MKLHPRVTRSAVELVKRFEGLRRRAARLPDGGWTIGYGHTLTAREGAVVSPEDAEALLYYDLSEVANKVEAWTFTPLNQNQFEALTAFTFNIGVENFRRSTVLKRVNEGQHLMAAAALELWRTADFGGEDLVIDALVRRRAAEKAHYLTPPEGFKPSPTPVLKPTYDHSVIEAAVQARAGRSAAVVDAPLEGETATATVKQRSEYEESEEEDHPAPIPFVSAAGGATARLHQLFPDKKATPEPEPKAEPEPTPFVLKPDPAEPELTAVNEALSTQTAEPVPNVQAPPSLGVPPAPRADISSSTEGFSGFAPPPVRQFEASLAFETAMSIAAAPAYAAETAPPPPQVLLEPKAKTTPLFDTPSSRSMFTAPEGMRTIRPVDTLPELETLETSHLDFDAVAMTLPDVAPRSRAVIYSSIGLLGVVLFAAALTSMLSGKATPLNLVIGLMGILLMTPAGGYFLLRFLNKRDGVEGPSGL